MSVSVYHRARIETRVSEGRSPLGSIEARAAIEIVRRQQKGIPVEGYPPAPLAVAAPTEAKRRYGDPPAPKPPKPVKASTAKKPSGPREAKYVAYCKVCGKRFDAKQPNAEICTQTCANKAYKARRKEREAANQPTPKEPGIYTSPTIEQERAANAARKEKRS